jgi:transposase-like protein
MKAAVATEDLMAAQQLASLTLSDDERAELKWLTMRRKTAQALALRAQIVLTCAEGGQNKEVAAKLGLDRSTVGKWRRRFVERRVDGLHDEPRSGAPRTVDDSRIEAVIVRTLESCPETPFGDGPFQLLQSVVLGGTRDPLCA